MQIAFPRTPRPNVNITTFLPRHLPRARYPQAQKLQRPAHTLARTALKEGVLGRYTIVLDFKEEKEKEKGRNIPICSSGYLPGDMSTAAAMETAIHAVDPTKLGAITLAPSEDGLVEEWHIEPNNKEIQEYQKLVKAAQELRETNTPVAFPTETVYGLGADATRSEAVRAIYAAKGRPSDNPLIVHVDSLHMLRGLLRGHQGAQSANPKVEAEEEDPIPPIYRPLIQKFWPGPLTIILPVPESGSQLAPEVTAGLSTFGARMPRSLLALALIRLAGCPLAAPSANASTRPSPTCAEHVFDDLTGRIATIIDGGPCEVGVESTVVDGLSSPPAVLRPGGISVEELRKVEGWEGVVVAYKDAAEGEKEGMGGKPRAPGMKYRHYSPKARVLLCEAARGHSQEEVRGRMDGFKRVGVIRTRNWDEGLGVEGLRHVEDRDAGGVSNGLPQEASASGFGATPAVFAHGTGEHSSSHSHTNFLLSLSQHSIPHATHLVPTTSSSPSSSTPQDIFDIHLGSQTSDVARGLFSALRELDKKSVEVIFVEGIDDTTGDDIAAAVMNRLRKAAEVRI